MKKKLFFIRSETIRYWLTNIFRGFISYSLSGAFFFSAISISADSKNKKENKNQASKEERPLAQQDVDKILKQYSFVEDFNQKEPEREISSEIFWRYSYTLPPIFFPIAFDLEQPDLELPATRGHGRAIDHLNRGRVHFLAGEISEAKNVWLSGRAHYGKTYPEHRRSDYFIAYTFLRMAKDLLNTQVDYDDANLKRILANASSFLEWAFILKSQNEDSLVDRFTPKGLYNLAAIKWRYGRYAGAFGAAEAGLDYLRKTGRKDYRAQYYRIIAEAHIRNHSYLDAVQTLDLAIRHNATKDQAAASFARVGDIYFDLNNYELAEDAYGMGQRIDEDLKQLSPAQLVLRGESLFWLGRFSEAQENLYQGLYGAAARNETSPLPQDFKPWAALRIADAYLARAAIERKEALDKGLKNIDKEDRDNLCEELEKSNSGEIPSKAKLALARYCTLIEKTKLEYYRVSHDYRTSPAGELAQLRSACLELPYYGGHNVSHARKLLESLKTTDIPQVAIEMGWACQVGSYTQRERSEDMLQRVRDFYSIHPNSQFLASFVEPVREYQATKLAPLFEKGQTYQAVSFFEANRKNLFPKIDREIGAKLFAAYADMMQPEKAKEFWKDHHDEADNTDIKLLREAIVAAELADKNKTSEWKKKNEAIARNLIKHNWNLNPSPQVMNYLQRFFQVASLSLHLDWLSNLAKAWSQSDSHASCDLELPLLSRRYDSDIPASEAKVLSRLTEIIDKRLPDLFKSDSSCALSLLELEQRIMRQKPPVDDFGITLRSSKLAALAQRYLARQNWPLEGDFLHMVWTVSEHLDHDGDTASATRLWQMIRDKAPSTAPETKFARTRLDPSRTELEKLWD